MRLVTCCRSPPIRRLAFTAGIQFQQFRPYFGFYASNMATHTTERDGSGTITVSPRNEADQSGLVVICHGLGDSAEGFVDVAEVR